MGAVDAMGIEECLLPAAVLPSHQHRIRKLHYPGCSLLPLVLQQDQARQLHMEQENIIFFSIHHTSFNTTLPRSSPVFENASNNAKERLSVD